MFFESNSKRLFTRLVNKSIPPRAYIVSQSHSWQGAHEKIHQKESMVRNISNILKCEEKRAMELYEEIPAIRPPDSLHVLKENVELFMKNGLSLESLSQNALLLTKDTASLRRKIGVLHDMRPRQIDDYVPLLHLSMTKLKTIASKFNEERDIVPGGSRIYFLSAKLKIPPNIVAKRCVELSYPFLQPFHLCKKKLEILMDYCAPMNILNGIYVFEFSEQKLISRLERMLAAGCDVKLNLLKFTDEQFEKVLNDFERNNSISQTNNSGFKEKFERLNTNKTKILHELEKILKCNQTDLNLVYYDSTIEYEDLDKARRNVQFLQTKSVSLPAIANSSAVLIMSLETIEKRLKLLGEMQPKQLDDLFPFIEIETEKLERYKKRSTREGNLGENNHIYYFSEKLNMSPNEISSKFITNFDVFAANGNELKRKLDFLLQNNVNRETIINERAFRYSYSHLQSNISELRDSGVEDIKAWMITANKARKNSIIERQQEEKNSADEIGSGIEYMANRLKWNKYDWKMKIKSHPFLANISLPKAKSYLDFLLNEANYTVDDVNTCLYIFSANVDEVKVRDQEMNAVNIHPKKLRLAQMAKSRKRYLRFIVNYCKNDMDNENTVKNARLIEERIKMELVLQKS